MKRIGSKKKIPKPTDDENSGPVSNPILVDNLSDEEELEHLAEQIERLDVEFEREEGISQQSVYTPRDDSVILSSYPLSLLTQFQSLVTISSAAPPWLTGTSINPALRAAYLHNMGHTVTLLIPFIPPEQQPSIFNPGTIFESPEEQIPAVLEAIEKRVSFSIQGLNIAFYPGRYDSVLGSILPIDNLQDYVPEGAADLIILEEPEHLTWYHTGKRWTKAHPAVVGIMHTNYVDYISRTAGKAAAGTIMRVNKFLVAQHVHVAIKLSDAVQQLPRQSTCFVHGVSEKFLHFGDAVAKKEFSFTKGLYFLGKALWAKGYEELLDVFSKHALKSSSSSSSSDPPTVDVFGSGADLPAITKEAKKRELGMTFHGAKDHMSDDMQQYRAFINPSTSDVVATTSAEALAMGKWLIVPQHACNEFFIAHFRNCLVYDRKDDGETFAAALNKALNEQPFPLSEGERNVLTWEAATRRFADVASQGLLGYEKSGRLQRAADKTAYVTYNVIITGIEAVRKAMAAQQRRGRRERNASSSALLASAPRNSSAAALAPAVQL